MTTWRQRVRRRRQIHALVFRRFEGGIIGEELQLALRIHALIIEHTFGYVNSLFLGIFAISCLGEKLAGV